MASLVFKINILFLILFIGVLNNEAEGGLTYKHTEKCPFAGVELTHYKDKPTPKPSEISSFSGVESTGDKSRPKLDIHTGNCPFTGFELPRDEDGQTDPNQ